MNIVINPMITPQQFSIITAEAEREGIPHGFARAILREYLQSEIIYLLAGLPGSEKLAFIGGTGLRLLYGLDRFSEDLDFDNCGLNARALTQLWQRLIKQLRNRGYAITFSIKSTGTEKGGKIIFSDLLYDLGLSSHRQEKLMIKVEYTSPRPTPSRTTAVLSRFGFLAQVTTLSLPALCARKLIALRERPRLQPRDLYDLVWFFSRRVTPDKIILRNYGVRSVPDFRDELLQLLQRHRSKFAEYERDLRPLALDQEKVSAIRFLPDLLTRFLS